MRDVECNVSQPTSQGSPNSFNFCPLSCLNKPKQVMRCSWLAGGPRTGCSDVRHTLSSCSYNYENMNLESGEQEKAREIVGFFVWLRKESCRERQSSGGNSEARSCWCTQGTGCCREGHPTCPGGHRQHWGPYSAGTYTCFVLLSSQVTWEGLWLPSISDAARSHCPALCVGEFWDLCQGERPEWCHGSPGPPQPADRGPEDQACKQQPSCITCWGNGHHGKG